MGDESSWARLATTHGLRFTHVVAGAAVTPTPEEEARLGLEIARINFFGVLRAFEFARRCKPAFKRFLLVSSDAVYSAPSIGGVAHSSPATPAVASYALSKLAAEAQIQRWRRSIRTLIASPSASAMFMVRWTETGRAQSAQCAVLGRTGP